MVNYIYRVTEENVDGCGGDATEFVQFHKPLNQTESALFAHALREAKIDSLGKDYSTGDMIEDALAKFAVESGIKGVICGAPYEGAFEF